MQSNLPENLQKLLNEKKIKYQNLSNFIKNYPQIEIVSLKSAYIIRGYSDRAWSYIISENEKDFSAILDKIIDKDENFVIFDEKYLTELREKNEITWILSAQKLYFPAEIILPELKIIPEPLLISDSRFIYENSSYKEYISVEYVKERIMNGFSAGIYVDNKLAAWGITQDDGAIGFLNVLPQYQRKGFAKAVTIFLIQKIRQTREIPFVHIEKDNIKSLSLAKSLGFVEYGNLFWLGK